MNIFLTKLIIALTLVSGLLSGEFTLTVKSPVVLAKHFNKGITHLNIIPGKDKTDYSKDIQINVVKLNKSGCAKYKEDFHIRKEEIGILLVDNDSCSLSTKIHYAQQAGASALFLKYLDNNIEEAEIEKSSFEGVRIPIFMLKSDDAKYIYDVLDAEKEDQSHLSLTLEHKTMIDLSNKRIQIFMSSQMINNSMVIFLKDLLEHGRLIKDYDISIKFSIGFCKSCQEKQFLRQEASCLSGGRYCVINSDFKSNELVKETLRQICIRNIYGVPTLVGYLSSLKQETEDLYFSQNFKEKEMQALSANSMRKNSIAEIIINNCTQSSYIKVNDHEVDPSLDDNELLKKEQQDFFSITKYNIFPLVIVNGVYYDRSTNVREFIKFGCENKMFDCRGFKIFKKLFLIVIAVISVILVLVVITYCRRVMKKKIDGEINVKVQEAIQRYLTVEKA